MTRPCFVGSLDRPAATASVFAGKSSPCFSTRPERAGKIDAIRNHMGNFHDATRSRKTPISDLESQHRTATTCHLGNIACRLGRPLKWNPTTETFVDDPEATTYLARERRAGYELV